jgi:UDP-N-acetyl-D-galactosamine dehydrogenase
VAEPRIAVIGLGYVGLPLAIALARHYPVYGFDTNKIRIAELTRGHDRTRELETSQLAASSLRYASEVKEIGDSDVHIITVPTPVDVDNNPDLTAVRAACRTVGEVMRCGAIVVLESTVYPGVTEDICGAELAKASGLMCGRDFFLGYSPERINPGDRQHTVDRITKVVSGQTPEVAATLAKIYGAVTTGGVFVAKNIKTAEAAKVIENAQRDINIAFINEVTMIFNRLGLSIYDVLDASATKWNFLRFTPGLVGGHCIGVDPFYLANLAERLGHHPAVVLSGRRINDRMGLYIAEQIDRLLSSPGARILVLGLTFKENVPDLRNSKVVDVIRGLAEAGHAVDVHDPLADADEARHEYGVQLLSTLGGSLPYDCVVGAVPHEEYCGFDGTRLAEFLAPGGLVADIKGMWRYVHLPDGIRRWEL